ncbi:hypothetical protein GCM10010191_88390 [Actinomadura vinacea]|uniref:XRE family transcriptional regulator n=2 Tax=Actinomadura vinacea TaxID=115336 RepID=A0ABN3KFL1_9ACTN
MDRTIAWVAGQAPMSPTTWSKVEQGGKVRDLTYNAVDRVLQWKEGACERFLRDAEEPQPADGVATGGTAPPGPSRALPAGAGVQKDDAMMAGPVRSPLDGGEIREWRVLPGADPDAEETVVVFWVGPADADMHEVAKEATERRRRSRAREAEAIAAQDRWEALFAAERAEAAPAPGDGETGEVDRFDLVDKESEGPSPE